MKTPITYYGGKQTLAPIITQLFPEHKLYGELFLGGGAVFFAKAPSVPEVINDTNGEVINFFRQTKYNFIDLERWISATLHSKEAHRKATVISANPDMFPEVQRAWALWVRSAQGFGGMLDSSWGYDISKNTTSKKIRNKREGFTDDYAIRLQDVQIECSDALLVLRRYDRPDSLFYCDPPYFNSDMGHYDGYTVEDFIMLMEALGNIQGKFLMSSYPSKELSLHIKLNGWYSYKKEFNVTVGAKSGKAKKKIEVLTANYPLKEELLLKDGWVKNK